MDKLRAERPRSAPAVATANGTRTEPKGKGKGKGGGGLSVIEKREEKSMAYHIVKNVVIGREPLYADWVSYAKKVSLRIATSVHLPLVILA
jgi:hypothetical protein